VRRALTITLAVWLTAPVPAHGDDPPTTVPVSAGECHMAEVDSFLVPRQRLDVLVELARQGAQVPKLVDDCAAVVASAQACADSIDDQQATLQTALDSINTYALTTKRAKSQRNAALVIVAATTATSGAVFTGFWLAQ
jgi:hypothetical protein